ncbi:MAG: PssE/Cps14G family polysaccharide biosynthesis glycosyltransferase [bacterium]|nr:PssE/Cps14G family polysaccharide biosynthesis glycosyltransferase [bacterium]
MILVTLGTQDKQFTRLLETVNKAITMNVIQEEVIVQAGCTPFNSDKMKIYDIIPIDEFDKLIKKCNILITHGGVGSIIKGIKNKKTVIAFPRLKKYKEHTNNHQLQIIKTFTEQGYILSSNKLSDLSELLKQAKNFKPKEYVSNTTNVIKILEEFIERT